MTATQSKMTLKPDSLSRRSLSRLKWATTVAIIGIPVLIQILGALMFYAGDYPALMSAQSLSIFGLAAMIVAGCGLYALNNRVFLRFSLGHQDLQEWESKTRSDAFAFSYRVIVKGVLIAFVGISVLGALMAANRMGWIDFSFGQSIVLNLEALAAMTIALTYLTLLLPTLYIAWTLSPISTEDGEFA